MRKLLLKLKDKSIVEGEAPIHAMLMWDNQVKSNQVVEVGVRKDDNEVVWIGREVRS